MIQRGKLLWRGRDGRREWLSRLDDVDYRDVERRRLAGIDAVVGNHRIDMEPHALLEPRRRLPLYFKRPFTVLNVTELMSGVHVPSGLGARRDGHIDDVTIHARDPGQFLRLHEHGSRDRLLFRMQSLGTESSQNEPHDQNPDDDHDLPHWPLPVSSTIAEPPAQDAAYLMED